MIILASEMKKRIEAWTERNCGFEERGYLGISQISRCPAELYDQMVDGRAPFTGRHARMCYEGYLHERDMVNRLRACRLFEEAPEVVAPWDDRFRGHPDGQIGTDTLIEIKSVTVDRFLEIRGNRPIALSHYEQVQMYLFYGGYRQAMIIYKCRETGELWLVMVYPSSRVQARLERKARAILAAVDAGQRPRCECGRHG